MKIFRSGKVVVMLSGRYAGKKAVIVNVINRKTKTRSFGHCIVAGINRYPKKITRRMSEKRIKRRSRIQPFVKIVNLSHVLPTRYFADLDLKKICTPEKVSQPKQRVKVRRDVKRVFTEAYKSGQNKWFFEKLRF